MRTKIIATIGPATESAEQLKALLDEGVNVFRLNMSHGKHDWHREMIKKIRKVGKESKRYPAILGDLQGPKIRMGTFDEEYRIHKGDKLSFTTNSSIGENKYPVDYPEFARDVRKGEVILVDDGKLVFEILDTDQHSEVSLKVIQGGILKARKGINLPDTEISQPAITEKDRNDLNLLLEENVDWIALSFVRSVDDILELRSYIPADGPGIMAKIEKPEALKNIDQIIRKSDAVMVARGDLGIEIPIQQVPRIQKDIVRKCLQFSKPVVIATQMMESMIDGITPSRAEVNDVANSAMDGADAVMLSAETSIGNYPAQTVNMMRRIIEDVEGFEGIYYKQRPPNDPEHDRFISDFVIHNACKLAKQVDAKAVVAMTHSGYSGYKLSSQRPKSRIFIFTSNKRLLHKFSLVWGIQSIYYDNCQSTDQTIGDIKHVLKEEGHLVAGDLIINITSMPISERGKSNTLKLSQI